MFMSCTGLKPSKQYKHFKYGSAVNNKLSCLKCLEGTFYFNL